MPPYLHLLPDAGGIDNVAVVGQGEGAFPAGHLEGLDVFHPSDIAGRIAYVADSGGPGQLRKGFSGKDFPHQAGILFQMEGAIGIAGGYAAALLSPVLEHQQPGPGHFGRILHIVAAKHAALLVQLIFPKKGILHPISCYPVRPLPVP